MILAYLLFLQVYLPFKIICCTSCSNYRYIALTYMNPINFYLLFQFRLVVSCLFRNYLNDSLVMKNSWLYISILTISIYLTIPAINKNVYYQLSGIVTVFGCSLTSGFSRIFFRHLIQSTK